MPGISPKLPLISSKEEGGFILNKTMKSTVSQNLKHLLLTNPGEKIFDSRFGCGLKRFIFEQFDSVGGDGIVSKINQQVAAYMPYVNLDKIDLKKVEENYAVHVLINYSVPSLSIRDVLSLNIIRN